MEDGAPRLAVLALVLGACGSPAFRWSQSVEPARFDDLRFASPKTHARFHAVRRCFALATRGRGFHRIAGRLGEQYGIWACRPGDEALCGGAGERRSQPGTEWYELVARPTEPRASSLGLQVFAGRNPERDGLAVSFEYRSAIRETEWAGYRIEVSRFERGRRQRLAVLQDPWRVPYGARDPIEVTWDRDRDLRAYVESAASLRDTALARLQEGVDRVASHLASPALRKLVCSPYEGGGIPPFCHEEPLTAEDQQRVLAEVRADANRSRAAIVDDADGIYRLVAAIVPSGSCWPD